MKGTKALQTRAILLTPPRITRAVTSASTPPVCQRAILKVSSIKIAIELDCTVQPIPKAAKAVKTANSPAQNLKLRARSKTYIGQQAMVPSAVLIRYLIDSRASPYLVAIPKRPVNQIHKTAPGPPIAIAVATPTMLPVPIVAAKAVVRAPNWLISPLDFFSLTK